MGSRRMDKQVNAFTLIELLIVIAIIAILGSATVLVLNPIELMSQSRDSTRVTDIKSLESAVSRYSLDNGTLSGITENVIYTSLTAASSNCSGLGLPVLPSGWSYSCVTNSANLRNSDGTGWLPINFNNVKGGRPLASLPVDPVNDPATGRYYTFAKINGMHEITAVTESKKDNPSAINDGGAAVGVIQAGTAKDITPVTRDRGLIGYWTFDESGSIANNQTTGLQDSSGGNNNGTALNPDGTGMAFVPGKSGNAINLDGVNDTVVIGTDNYNIPFKEMTIAFWMNTSTATPTTYGMALHRSDNANIGQATFFGGVETGTNQIVATVGANVVGWTAGTTGVIAVPGTWNYVVCSWNGTNGRVYVDGVEKKNYALAASNFTNRPATTRIGSSASSSAYLLNGKVDDVRIYNRALDVNEIMAIYSATNK